ncbi:MAG TPA: monovalent cation/H(+) antiporter subunit G [Pseudonocardiaceae bacterium]|nr:monovalent cation/H(+) antiporter subunit G [Pseudonocardiaceae bacterium]
MTSTVVEIVLLATGIAGVALGCAGLLVARETLLRLHYLGPASSLGAPLIIAALVVDAGLSTLAIKLILIGVLLVGSGAVTVSAFGRATAQRQGLVETDPPA